MLSKKEHKESSPPSPSVPESDPIYRVRTYDANTGGYSAQEGIAEYVTGFRGLLNAVRELRSWGYPANRNAFDSDPAVLIERVSPEAE